MKRLFVATLVIIILLSACSTSVDTPTDEIPIAPEMPENTPNPTPTEKPPVVLTVCTVGLPSTLFPYAESPSTAKNRILALLYPASTAPDNDTFSTTIFEKTPTQADGDMRFEPTAIQRGQTIVDARGEIITAAEGAWVRPSGCRSDECTVTWNGVDPLEMDRMVIEYKLREGLTWADESPVKAVDSVFSYLLANDPQSPLYGWAEKHTFSFTALDEHTLSWISYPGFSFSDLTKFFWVPLPSAQFEPAADWAEVSADEVWASSPPAYGAFKMAAWTNDEIILVRNPLFTFADEVLPGIDQVVFRNVENGPSAAWLAMQEGACDVLDETFKLAAFPELLFEIEEREGYDVRVQQDESWTQLVFGIKPAEFDGLTNPLFAQRPDYFGDLRTRQAIAMCLDRETMLEAAALNDWGNPWPSFLPLGKSLLSEETRVAYDPGEGVDLLEAAGWRDHDFDPATPRIALSAANIFDGTEMNLDLLVSDSAFHQSLAEIIELNLTACGIGVRVETLPVPELYAPGPNGRLFGRDFDMALIAWQALPGPDCGLYLSWNTPNFTNDWIGTNVAGLSNNEYDRACAAALLATPKEYEDLLNQAEETFVNQLPAVPLISPVNIEVWRLDGK